MHRVFRRWWFSKSSPLGEVVAFLVGFLPTTRWVIEAIIDAGEDSDAGFLPGWLPLATLLDVPAVLLIGLGAGIAVGAALTLAYRTVRFALSRPSTAERRDD